MTLAKTIVDDSLEILNEGNHFLPIDSKNQNRAFKQLTRMFQRFSAENLDLGVAIPASINADLREPSWATSALVFNLAKEVAPFLQRRLSPEAREQADEQMDIVRTNARQSISVQFPETLPTGGGNDENWPFHDRFFHGSQEVEYDIYDQIYVGEERVYNVDFTENATARATSVASVEWSNESGVVASITEQSLSSDLAQATLSFTSTGKAKIRVRATYANGHDKDAVIYIQAVRP